MFAGAAKRFTPPDRRMTHSLPIESILPAIADSLHTRNRLIIEAAPGAGKTSRVPLALLRCDWMRSGKLVMLEPRRLAARSAARLMARLLGEGVGKTVGYRTAVDSREGATTRILVVTEGILTRMIQADPALEGINCLIFDEFHERSLQADLGLAFSLDAQESLRPDLRLVIMSATLDGDRLSALLGGCPRLHAEGRVFPVEVRYLPGRLEARCEDQVAAAVGTALRNEQGSILAFLPGAAEIRRAAERLAPALPPQVRVYPLYGDLSPEEQDAAVAPPAPGERKVVLATNLAESSLTIEGVRIIVDSGLARTLRYEPAWDMSRLVTERISRASAEQRRGRAGRLEPGLCLRLWAEHEHPTLRADIRPEILEADLATLCLDVAAWGLPVNAVPDSLHWLDPPPARAWEQARQTLRALDALDAADRITRKGLAMSALPLHPRLAHMVREAKTRNQGMHACALAALFSERDPLRQPGRAGQAGQAVGADVTPRLALLLDARHTGGPVRRLREQMRRIAGRASIRQDGENDTHLVERAKREDPAIGPLIALAWPDRVALRRGPGSYLLAGGRGASLHPDDPLNACDCLAVAALQSSERSADARILLAAPLRRDDLENLFPDHLRREDVIRWDAERQAVSARTRVTLGALVLAEHPLQDPDPETVRDVLLQAVGAQGLQALPWTDALRTWRRRVLFVRFLIERGRITAAGSQPWPELWPDMSDAALAAGLRDWLGPFLDGAVRLADITPALLEQALHAVLPWPSHQRLEALAPESLHVPSGSRIRLEYGVPHPDSPPVLAVKLQEMFGQTETPAVAEGAVPVLVHLLSPAGRPVQVTADLAGFWRDGYKAVRAELRGRYPKHPWPEDPLTALPSRRTKKAMQPG